MTRRSFAAGMALATCLSWVPASEAEQALLAQPDEGNCVNCVGEVNDTLNSCAFDAASCISTSNDDREHFTAPWIYDGEPAEAVDQLVAVATGGSYESGLINAPFGIRRADAAAFIAGGFTATLQGKRPPQRPQRQEALASSAQRFDGVVAERRRTAGGSEYVRLVFGARQPGNADTGVIDADFLFLSGDNIVDIRAASRAAPGLESAKVGLSFSDGLEVDRNTSRRLLQRLRQALRWEEAPVITGFDPRFNQSQPLWFERLYQPFLRGNMRTPAGDEEDSSDLALHLPRTR
ncbi:hypothetical protein WJX81_000307 [Elliptochloris bilobata]|uniref:Uncharacterized protein n=1 Tax=Elliptochloris bilobata TaxID=381761 RepID=A0AAW1RTU6_9CHLO